MFFFVLIIPYATPVDIGITIESILVTVILTETDV